jgi:hypothetical protein
VAEVEDHLFRNLDGTFVNVTPLQLQSPGASHGVAWADFDADGDLDLSLANNHPEGGGNPLFRNSLPPAMAARSVQVRVLDGQGRHAYPGAEVRLLDSATGNILGSRLVDAGGGYCSQGSAPVHFGIPGGVESVEVEVTVLRGGARVTHSLAAVSVPLVPYRILEVRVPAHE